VFSKDKKWFFLILRISVSTIVAKMHPILAGLIEIFIVTIQPADVVGETRRVVILDRVP